MVKIPPSNRARSSVGRVAGLAARAITHNAYAAIRP
jgi:hypothetical protein